MSDNYRHAVLRNQHDNLLVIRAYLPSNYGADSDGRDVYLHGIDVAGWTLDGYVLPRLASGLYFGREVVAVESLTAGQRFEFSEDFGGEGETVTATGPAINLMGTRTVGTEELDFDLEFPRNAYVTVVND